MTKEAPSHKSEPTRICANRFFVCEPSGLSQLRRMFKPSDLFDLAQAEPTSLRRKAREWGVFYLGDEEVEPPPVPPAPPEP